MYDMLCKGCGHRIAMQMLDELINSYNLKNKVIMALDVACCSLLIDYVDYDSIMCPHGRVIPVSMGITTTHRENENVVISYMGDGACYAIGLNEIMQAAHRNEKIFLVVVNNGIYAMTGGQKTITYYEYKIFDIKKHLDIDNISYFGRAVLSDKKHIDEAKVILKEAFDSYLKNGGFNMVEFLSPCPTNYKMSYQECAEFLNKIAKEKYGL